MTESRDVDDAIKQLSNDAEYAAKHGDLWIKASPDVILEMSRRLDQSPACIRQVSTHDLLIELLNRETRKQLYPEAMKTAQGV